MVDEDSAIDRQIRREQFWLRAHRAFVAGCIAALILVGVAFEWYRELVIWTR